MKILLISPNISKSNSVYSRKISSRLNIFPPLTLPQLAGITPKTHEVKVVYESYKKINFDWEADIVGISCLTPEVNRGYSIADEFRKRRKTVVIGGWHASALPEEAKKHADSVVIGEAEETWPKLLHDFERGDLKPFYRNNQPVDLNFIPSANRNVGDGLSFMAAVQTSRGCPMGCEFCCVTNNPEGRVFRTRSIDLVVEEIKKIKNKTLYFYDPSLTIDTDFTKKLFKAIKGLNKKFSCFGNANILAKDDELIRLAKDAGCQNWYVGFESVSQKTIDYLGKKSNKVQEYSNLIEKIHNHDMIVTGSFIFGFDTDTKNVFNDTIEAVYDLAIDVPEFTILTPYPGTPLFKRLDAEGRILTRDWSRYTETGNVVFQPRNMSPRELLEGCEKAIYEVFSFSNIIGRAIKNRKFLFHNILSNTLQHSKK